MQFSDMITLARDYIGEDSEGNWTDAAVKRAINRGLKEVYNQIVNMNQEFFAIQSTIDWVSGTETYTLPAAGVQRILLVEYVSGTYKQALRRVPIQDKEQYQNQTMLRNTRGGFWYMFGNKLGFKPTPVETRTAAVNLFNVPPMVDLVANGDKPPLDWTDQQHEVAVMGAVVRLVMRSKELIKVYQPNFDRLWKGMIDDMQNRDSQDPKMIRPPELGDEC